jgi:hypothetical protein
MSDLSGKPTNPSREAEGTEPSVKPPLMRRSLSMHADVPVWYDCCSCEAEPYWVERLGEPPGEEVEENTVDPACAGSSS